MRAWEECGHADIDLETALYFANDGALNSTLVQVRLLDLTPHAKLLGFGPRQHDPFLLRVGRVKIDVDLLTLVHGDPAITQAELGEWNVSLGFIADINGDELWADLHDASAYDLPRLDRPQALLEQLTEVFPDPAAPWLRRCFYEFFLVLFHSVVYPLRISLIIAFPYPPPLQVARAAVSFFPCSHQHLRAA